MANEKRLITKIYLDQTGEYTGMGTILVVDAQGRVIDTGWSISDVIVGEANLNADQISQVGTVNKFVTQADLDKLLNIEVSDPVDLTFLQTQILELANADYVQEITDLLDF